MFITASLDGAGSVRRFHQPGDFLGNGTEVCSNCPSEDRLFISAEVSSAELEGEDLEDVGGPRDPSEGAFDVFGVAKFTPTAPGRGLVASGACNH